MVFFEIDFSLTLIAFNTHKMYNVENATAFMTNQDKSTILTNNHIHLLMYITLKLFISSRKYCIKFNVNRHHLNSSMIDNRDVYANTFTFVLMC